MAKRHVDRTKPFTPKAECILCGAKVEATEEKMHMHLLARHPLDLLQHPDIGGRIAQAAFDLGQKLAGVLSHGRKSV
jgi:hypothetical protein